PQSSSREQQALSALRSGLLPELQQKFQTRLYRLDTGVTRVNSPDELGEPGGSATHIGASLEQLTAETADLPLGAVVLLSDGGDNAGGVDRSVIESLRNRRIPVYTVGFGPQTPTQDAQMEDVVIATRTLAGSRLNATVKFQQHGFRGRQSTLTVRDGAQVLTSKAITFGSDGEVQT